MQNAAWAEWQRCRPWIESALAYSGDTHTIEDIEAAIGEQKMIFLAGAKCALVCEVIIYPRLRAFHIVLAGGDLTELRAFDQNLAELARALACTRITIAGRPGWARALKDLGYAPGWTVLCKEI